MSYRPFKAIGTRTFTNMSGSSQLVNVGNTVFASTLSVSGALTLAAPASGSAAGNGSYLAVDSDGVVVLDTPGAYTYNGPPIGCVFTSSYNTRVELQPGGIDSVAIIPVMSGTSLKNVILSGSHGGCDNLIAFSTGSGIQGLDTGSIASNKGYYFYVITKANVAEPVMIFSTSSSDPTMPTDYTYKSQALFFMNTNSSDTFLRYSHRADGWTYTQCKHGSTNPYGQLITNGRATAVTAVNASDVLPYNGRALLSLEVGNRSNTNCAFYLYANRRARASDPDDQSMNYSIGNFRANSNGWSDPWRDFVVELMLPADPSTDTFYYDWDPAPATSDMSGFQAYAIGWKVAAFC